MSNNSHRDNDGDNSSGPGKVTKADLIWTAIIVIAILFGAGSGLLP